MKRLLKLAALALTALLILIGADYVTGRHVAYLGRDSSVLRRGAVARLPRLFAISPYGQGRRIQATASISTYPDEAAFRWWSLSTVAAGARATRVMRIGGADIYGNIGRVISPDTALAPQSSAIGFCRPSTGAVRSTTWRRRSSRRATALIARGARPTSLFLMGHSAGAQLVTRVALDPAPLVRAGGSTALVCGVIPVSGAALDLTDQQTWDLGARHRLLP